MRKRKLKIYFGFLISLFLVWFVFRDTDWGEVASSIHSVNWFWLIASETVIILSFITRVQRWHYIVQTEHLVPFSTVFSATQIGFLGNYILPGRVGEIIRALVLSRLARLSVTKCIAFVALDRLADMLSLMIVLLIAIFTFKPAGNIILPQELYSKPIPGNIVLSVAWGTAIFLTIILVFLILLYLNQHLVRRLSDFLLIRISVSFAQRINFMIKDFAEGLQVFHRRVDILKSLLFSLITWALMIYSYVCVFNAFDIQGPWNMFFILTSFLAVAVSIPGAPGFIGQFHFAVAVTIVAILPGTDLNVAKAIAIVAHLLNLIPVVLIGMYCVYHNNFELLKLRNESEAISQPT